MGTIIKRISCAALLIVVCAMAIPRSAWAVSAIAIDGVVYDDKNNPVAGTTVVAWCGDIHHFGGAGTTDAQGHYSIHTNSDDCPLGSELTVTTDVDVDGRSDGAAHTTTHTATTVSIRLGSYTTVAVPEFTWLSLGAAGLVGAGALAVVRQARSGHSRGATCT